MGVANMVMSTGLGGLKPNTLVILFPDGPNIAPRYPDLSAILQRWSADESLHPAAHGSAGRQNPDVVDLLGTGVMDSASMRELTSNSVYEPRADNGCRVTSAYQRELWTAQPDARTAGRARAMLG